MDLNSNPTRTSPVPIGSQGQTICDHIRAYDWHVDAWVERCAPPGETPKRIKPGEYIHPWWRWARYCEPVSNQLTDITIFLTEEELKALDSICKKQERTRQEICKTALIVAIKMFKL